MIKLENLPSPLTAKQQMIYNLISGQEVYKVNPASVDELYTAALLEFIRDLKPPVAAAQKRTRKAAQAAEEK